MAAISWDQQSKISLYRASLLFTYVIAMFLGSCAKFSQEFLFHPSDPSNIRNASKWQRYWSRVNFHVTIDRRAKISRPRRCMPRVSPHSFEILRARRCVNALEIYVARRFWDHYGSPGIHRSVKHLAVEEIWKAGATKKSCSVVESLLPQMAKRFRGRFFRTCILVRPKKATWRVLLSKLSKYASLKLTRIYIVRNSV